MIRVCCLYDLLAYEFVRCPVDPNMCQFKAKESGLPFTTFEYEAQKCTPYAFRITEQKYFLFCLEAMALWTCQNCHVVRTFPICYLYDYSDPKINPQLNDNQNVNLAFHLNMTQAPLQHKCLSTNRKQFRVAMKDFPYIHTHTAVTVILVTND